MHRAKKSLRYFRIANTHKKGIAGCREVVSALSENELPSVTYLFKITPPGTSFLNVAHSMRLYYYCVSG